MVQNWPNKTEIVEPPQRGRCKGCKWGARKGEDEETAQKRAPDYTRAPARALQKSLSLPSDRALKHFSCTHGPPRAPPWRRGGRPC